MAFDLSTAKPAESSGGGFDLSTAKPADEILKGVKERQKESKPKPKPSARVDLGSAGDFASIGPRVGAGIGETALNMGTGMIAKPVSDVAGLAATLKDVFSGNKGGDPGGFKREVQDRMTYEPRTSAGRAMTQYNPAALLGRLFGWGGEKAEHAIAGDSPGPLRAAAGYGVREAVPQILGMLGMKGGSAAGEAAAPLLKDNARGMMQSALKPSAQAQSKILPATGKTKTASAIDTLLDNGVNVTRGGADTLRARIEKINDQIDTIVNNAPGSVDKKTVAAYLHDSVKKFEKQVTPLDDLAQIQKAWDEFLAVHPDKIPIKDAQALKRGTYRSLGEKSYGEVKGASVEAQKTLARGLKTEMEKQLPQVRPLGSEESQLLNALSLVEKRVLMSANKNPMGLSLLTTSPAKWAAFMADRSELFKSIVARMLNTGSKAAAPLGVGAGAMSLAAGQRPGQIPAPPQGR